MQKIMFCAIILEIRSFTRIYSDIACLELEILK